ncbi:hypothetical protein AWB69_09213 [Caballeronia udeis]|uniref:Uncharacterized protein n=1 Tax=Caballeronia udeis TaxID=1232866 RepID=A0A158K082_9BURK|nr:hypothetical protein AWB69_09213 [Caballeronia udeis]
MPDIADRHTDPKFAAVCLLALGIVHAGTKHIELKLTDAALHAKQQAVVCPARIVHTVEVDYARFDKTAKLEKMVPVAPVSSEA